MANIWNDIEIEWQGETYTVKPTIEFINYLESGEGRSLSQLLIRLGNRDLPSTIACELIAKTLTFAGAEKITTADVFMETGGAIGTQGVNLASTIILACLPTPKEKPLAKKKAVKPQK